MRQVRPISTRMAKRNSKTNTVSTSTTSSTMAPPRIRPQSQTRMIGFPPTLKSEHDSYACLPTQKNRLEVIPERSPLGQSQGRRQESPRRQKARRRSAGPRSIVARFQSAPERLFRTEEPSRQRRQ